MIHHGCKSCPWCARAPVISDLSLFSVRRPRAKRKVKYQLPNWETGDSGSWCRPRHRLQVGTRWWNPCLYIILFKFWTFSYYLAVTDRSYCSYCKREREGKKLREKAKFKVGFTSLLLLSYCLTLTVLLSYCLALIVLPSCSFSYCLILTVL
jgi:hypothetical protein